MRRVPDADLVADQDPVEPDLVDGAETLVPRVEEGEPDVGSVAPSPKRKLALDTHDADRRSGPKRRARYVEDDAYRNLCPGMPEAKRGGSLGGLAQAVNSRGVAGQSVLGHPT